MSSKEASLSRKRKRPATGPYTLRPLIENVPLSADGGALGTKITCVEYWENNLYIGTSASEILHLVCLPEEPQGKSQQPTFILASRLEPTPASSPQQTCFGVQQIVLLPKVNKACVLCNGTLTFYNLPELTPANTKVSNCISIGGRDLDLGVMEGGEGEIIMVCMKNRVRLVRIAEEPPKLVKNLDYPGCLVSARRGRFACVADNHSYALLDLDNQQKIPLFSISSLDSTGGGNVRGGIEDVGSSIPSAAQSLSSAQSRRDGGETNVSGHGRSTSLGAFVSGLGRNQQDVGSRSGDRPGLMTSDTGQISPLPPVSPTKLDSHRGSPGRPPSTPDKPLPSPPDLVSSQKAAEQAVRPKGAILPPHICSPLSTEFLLVTGTLPNEPGIGIFVNCDGGVVRGTLEFTQFPSAVIVDGGDPLSEVAPGESVEDGYILATVQRTVNGEKEYGVEIQRWDVTDQGKAWLEVPYSGSMALVEDAGEDAQPQAHPIGLGKTKTPKDMSFPEAGEKLRSRRLKIPKKSDPEDTQSRPKLEESFEEWETTRNRQEDEFSHRLGHTATRVVTWAGTSVSWAVRNPMVLRLDSIVDHLLEEGSESRLDQGKLLKLLSNIRDQEARNETEFLSLNYIRQKISIILFADLAVSRFDDNPQITENIFLEGGLDPRVILSMVPMLRGDIIEGPRGIWIHAGLVNLIQHQLQSTSINLESDEVLSRPEDYDMLGLIKNYLTSWRKRKGFASVADESQVFATVDAALLHVLLYQDQQSLSGPGGSSYARADLYSIVDHGVNCFERAIELLEEFRRLYVLSRLYQSRRLSTKVLETWRRIIEGEKDDGGELVDGENEVRKYIVKIKDLGLVEEYGTWLARRNPKLGVQVFTDDSSRVKLPPNQVVKLLKLQAPDSVKVFLEHLVFGKKNVNYANDLISYYLDSVIDVLESSEDARAILAQSYESYRALQHPKPTYRQFITDNAVPQAWWHDRLRLLELLGGSHGASFSYDVAAVLSRIEPFEASLVPESIILDGRQGRHSQALRLLTHGLGDYHTAINYCLLGGSSIFHPTSTRIDPQALPTRDDQAALFKHLFSEFLRIEDATHRIERTSELLERFGAWFDVAFVLGKIPDSWSVELVAGFLVGAFRRLVQDKSEAMIVKALSGAENLSVSVTLIERCETAGPRVEAVA